MGYITVLGHNQSNEVLFEKCALLTKCFTKNDQVTIDDAEDLNLVMPMYNWLECRLNYSKVIGLNADIYCEYWWLSSLSSIKPR